MDSRLAILAAAAIGVLIVGSPRAQTPTALPQFSDVTTAAGIHFRHNSGAFGKKYLPETLGSGVAFLDEDNDGWQDILLVNGRNWPGQSGAPSFPALYRNNGNGTFTDITRSAGLAVEMYGMGVSVGDYDNDGDADIYITALGPNHLFRNNGGGHFEDVTAKAGVGDPGFSTSAVWFDYDRDGKLDLFVGNYVEWSVDKDLFCTLNGKTKSYCTPESYKGQSPTLYHNNGDGTFENVTRKAGVYDPAAKTLGLALIDYDNDGLLDVFAANDTQPNRLYRNKGDGTFADVAVMRVYWDQILVADGNGRATPHVTRVDAATADLHWRGFSRETTPDGREPIGYDYQRVSTVMPWKSFVGRYTREGDVRTLLDRVDDMFVIARPGDEIALSFDASALPPLESGWARTFLLYANGYSKEMNPRSASPDTVGPLPFRKMTKYPYGPDEHYPDDAAHRDYLERFNTRVAMRPIPSIYSVTAREP